MRRSISIRISKIVALVIAALILSACGGPKYPGRPEQVPGGDPVAGQAAILEYGCGNCHTIPGVHGATGTVGPPLIDWAARDYIAGALPNTAENLVFWIMNPQEVEPGTIMPDLGVSEEDAKDIAAYLYTLDEE